MFQDYILNMMSLLYTEINIYIYNCKYTCEILNSYIYIVMLVTLNSKWEDEDEMIKTNVLHTNE